MDTNHTKHNDRQIALLDWEDKGTLQLNQKLANFVAQMQSMQDITSNGDYMSYIDPTIVAECIPYCETLDDMDEHKFNESVVKFDFEDAEDDFKLARENIKDMLEQSKDIMEEYTELVKGTDAPRAFEVFSKMALSHAELAKNLMDLHEQKQKLKQTSSANPPEASSTTNIGNQQNIMVSPAELVKMLKNEPN
jgi:tetrahydromethanopterin S-methyltransferase subunit A